MNKNQSPQKLPASHAGSQISIIPNNGQQQQKNSKKKVGGKGKILSNIEQPLQISGALTGGRVNTSNKAGLQFGVPRVARFMKEGRYSQRIGGGAPIVLASVLQYISSEILELAGDQAKRMKKQRINPRHVMLAIKEDPELNKLIAAHADFSSTGVVPNLPKNNKKGLKGGKGKDIQDDEDMTPE